MILVRWLLGVLYVKAGTGDRHEQKKNKGSWLFSMYSDCHNCNNWYGKSA